MATTVNFASSLADDFYIGDGIALEEDYATIMFTWDDVNGYPEVIIEQALSDSEYADDWFPIFIQKYNYEEPVKFRINDTNGSYSLNIYPILATTAYVRVKVNANGTTVGTLVFDASVGA